MNLEKQLLQSTQIMKSILMNFDSLYEKVFILFGLLFEKLNIQNSVSLFIHEF
jgi:hypothetical protein